MNGKVLGNSFWYLRERWCERRTRRKLHKGHGKFKPKVNISKEEKSQVTISHNRRKCWLLALLTLRLLAERDGLAQPLHGHSDRRTLSGMRLGLLFKMALEERMFEI